MSVHQSLVAELWVAAETII